MFNRAMVAAVALIVLGPQAMAQDQGGLRLAPGTNGGPVGLARPLPFTRPPFLTARDVQNGMTAADHQAQNQNMITRLRGDAGLLAGFSFGTPLAASVQNQMLSSDGGIGQPQHHDRQGGHRHGGRPVIINNNGPVAVTVGNGNVVQQQSAKGSGPIAQQQVATVPGVAVQSGGAVNLVSGGGNILQSAPGAN